MVKHPITLQWTRKSQDAYQPRGWKNIHIIFQSSSACHQQVKKREKMPGKIKFKKPLRPNSQSQHRKEMPLRMNHLERSRFLFKCHGSSGVESKGKCRNPSERPSRTLHSQIKLLNGLCKQVSSKNFNFLQRWLVLHRKTN